MAKTATRQENKKKSGRLEILESAMPLGVVTIVSALLLPIFYKSLLPYAVTVTIEDILLVVVPICILTGAVTFILGKVKDRTTFIDGLTVISVLTSFLLCLLLLFLFLRGLWFSGIGPSAEVVLPDKFKGVVEIRVLNRIEPSLATAARTYRYEVPDSGYLLVQKGWINTTQHYEGDRSYPGMFFTHLRRKNGSPLQKGTFNCSWLFAGGIRCEIN